MLAVAFLGILSKICFLTFGESVGLVVGARHVDFFSSACRSSMSLEKTLLLLSLSFAGFFFTGVGGVRLLLESIDVDRLAVVVVVCEGVRDSDEANGET